ncbi:signal transduction histidine kinase [Nocardioides cavernae]|uniref:histidine kinase n=1 Tax=Nocardioides cavernae TaxID=1921566 RepID=A0A7Y9H574_9ACTN|nr:histidine kinase [Nocardioides cavernae]NYE38134.1 signal transduction histidine kinase [Nocardioides cavernae]
MALRRTWTTTVWCTWVAASALLTGIALASPEVGGDLAGAPGAGSVAWACGLALVAAQAAALLWSPRRPALALLLVAAAAPAAALFLGPAAGCTSVAVLVAAFRATLDVAAPRTWQTLAAAVLLVGVGDLLTRIGLGPAGPSAVVGALVQGVGTVGIAALAGTIVGTRRESRRAREERDRAAARERSALVEVAVARERTAMARELHDIAAHHLTGIAVMTGAISRQIDRDPEGAKRAVDQVREQSTEMLRDMRGLVALLRPASHGPDGTDSDGGAVQQHSFDGVPQLVADATARGGLVDLVVLEPEGEDPRDRIGPLAQLSAYRTVQEALSNAARHAPGRPCRVEVDARSADGVQVTITSEMAGDGDGAGPGRTGFGLVGMRERAELTDSRVTYGPEQGHWVVRLRVPARDDRVVARAPDAGTGAGTGAGIEAGETR